MASSLEALATPSARFHRGDNRASSPSGTARAIASHSRAVSPSESPSADAGKISQRRDASLHRADTACAMAVTRVWTRNTRTAGGFRATKWQRWS